MKQDFTALAGVDHGGNGTEFDDGQYGNQSLRTVLKNDRNDITAAYALRSQVVRNLVCAALALLALVAPVAPTFGALPWVLSLFIAAFSILVYLSSEQMISNSQQIAGAR